MLVCQQSSEVSCFSDSSVILVLVLDLVLNFFDVSVVKQDCDTLYYRI